MAKERAGLPAFRWPARSLRIYAISYRRQMSTTMELELESRYSHDSSYKTLLINHRMDAEKERSAGALPLSTASISKIGAQPAETALR
jgi:hypothetical protein